MRAQVGAATARNVGARAKAAYNGTVPHDQAPFAALRAAALGFAATEHARDERGAVTASLLALLPGGTVGFTPLDFGGEGVWVFLRQALVALHARGARYFACVLPGDVTEGGSTETGTRVGDEWLLVVVFGGGESELWVTETGSSSAAWTELGLSGGRLYEVVAPFVSAK